MIPLEVNIVQHVHHGSRTRIAGIAAIVLLGIAALGRSLWYAPTDSDDLILLSAVARAPAPWDFFVGDWGGGKHVYRPLHSAALWAGYRLAGVTATYNQSISLALHLIACCLLYTLLLRVQRSAVIALLFAAVPVVSRFTRSPATWVSDRPTLLVAICLLAVLHVLVTADRSRRPASHDDRFSRLRCPRSWRS